MDQNGEANTKYFQIMANIKQKNNFIAALNSGTETAINQDDKHHLIFEHFQDNIKLVPAPKGNISSIMQKLGSNLSNSNIWTYLSLNMK
jgi:hypothetical protein